MKLLKITIIVMLATTICCCTKKQLIATHKPVEILYNSGLQKLTKSKTNQEAVSIFKDLMINYPFSEYALKAQILMAYIQYNQNNFKDAEESLENYINNYPGSKYNNYTYYMIAVSRFRDTALNSTDYSMLIETKLSLEYAKNKYPDSIYNEDINKRIKAINNVIAKRTIEIGVFYYKNEKYNAAINRLETVINSYPNTNHVPEALYYASMCYEKMFDEKKSNEYKKILLNKYKNTKWSALMTKNQPLSKK